MSNKMSGSGDAAPHVSPTERARNSSAIVNGENRHTSAARPANAFDLSIEGPPRREINSSRQSPVSAPPEMTTYYHRGGYERLSSTRGAGLPTAANPAWIRSNNSSSSSSCSSMQNKGYIRDGQYIPIAVDDEVNDFNDNNEDFADEDDNSELDEGRGPIMATSSTSQAMNLRIGVPKPPIGNTSKTTRPRWRKHQWPARRFSGFRGAKPPSRGVAREAAAAASVGVGGDKNQDFSNCPTAGNNNRDSISGGSSTSSTSSDCGKGPRTSGGWLKYSRGEATRNIKLLGDRQQSQSRKDGSNVLRLVHLVSTRLIGGQLLLCCVFLAVVVLAAVLVISSGLNLFEVGTPWGTRGSHSFIQWSVSKPRRPSEVDEDINDNWMDELPDAAFAMWNEEGDDESHGGTISASRQAAIAAMTAWAANHSLLLPVSRILKPFFRDTHHPLLRRIFSLASNPLSHPWQDGDAVVSAVIRTNDSSRILLVLQEPHVSLGPNYLFRQHLTCLLPAVPRLLDSSACFSPERQPEHPPVVLPAHGRVLVESNGSGPPFLIGLSQATVASTLHAMHRSLSHFSDSWVPSVLTTGSPNDFREAFSNMLEKIEKGSIKPTKLKGVSSGSFELLPEVFRAFGAKRDRAAANAARDELLRKRYTKATISLPDGNENSKVTKRLLSAASKERPKYHAQRQLPVSKSRAPGPATTTTPAAEIAQASITSASKLAEEPLSSNSITEALPPSDSSKPPAAKGPDEQRPSDWGVVQKTYDSSDYDDIQGSGYMVKAPSVVELWKTAGGAPPLVHLSALLEADHNHTELPSLLDGRAASNTSEWLWRSALGWTIGQGGNMTSSIDSAGLPNDSESSAVVKLLNYLLPPAGTYGTVVSQKSSSKSAASVAWNSFSIGDDNLRIIYYDFRVVTAELLNLLNVTWFTSFGTWLGALRHQMMTPWDDDFDVLIPKHQLPWLVGFLNKGKLSDSSLLHTAARAWWAKFVSDVGGESLAEAIANVYAAQLDIYVKSTWQQRSSEFTAKVFLRNSPQIHVYPWKSPFLDIFTFSVTWPSTQEPLSIDTHGYYVVAAAEIFPLVYRPVDGLSTPLPSTAYGGRVSSFFSGKNESPFTECVSGYWSHVLEKSQQSSVLPCSVLHPRIPFVTRRIHIRSPRAMLPVFPPAEQVPKSVDELYREGVALDRMDKGFSNTFSKVTADPQFGLDPPPPPSLPLLYEEAMHAANAAAQSVARRSSMDFFRRRAARAQADRAIPDPTTIGEENNKGVYSPSYSGQAQRRLEALAARNKPTQVDLLDQFELLLTHAIVVNVSKNYPGYSPLRVMTAPDFIWADGLVEVTTVGQYVTSELISFSGHNWNLGDMDFSTFRGK